MIERKKAYLRRKDTIVANMLTKLAPQIGSEWRQSHTKQTLERNLALPISLLARPVTLYLSRQALKDGIEPFYEQPRVGSDLTESLSVTKIRTMFPNSDASEMFGSVGSCDARGDAVDESLDPRVTRFGRRLRRYELDELPQLADVGRKDGKLSFIGLRAVHMIDVQRLKSARASTKDFAVWEQAYSEDKPSLLHLHAVMDKKRKEDNTRRYHYDLFYARNASLALDLYIMYKALTTTWEKIRKKR